MYIDADHSVVACRLRPLVAGICAALALGIASSSAMAADASGRRDRQRGSDRVAVAPRDFSLAATRIVNSCLDDGGAGTLRKVIESAADGDTIDLRQLTCSTIALFDRILIVQPNLTLSGPQNRVLTVSGPSGAAGQPITRVFTHPANGDLRISNLSIAHGADRRPGPARGGCIASSGTVRLNTVSVDDCVAEATGDFSDSVASGGAIYSEGVTELINSRVTGSTALVSVTSDDGRHAQGGGIYAAAGFQSAYSTISGNKALNGPAQFYTNPSFGGGVCSQGNVTIRGSVLDSNGARRGGALEVGEDTAIISIINSTISGNRAKYAAGVQSRDTLVVASSTVAFNIALLSAGGINADGAATLQSSIVANNEGGSFADFDTGDGNTGSLTGTNNLMLSSRLGLSGTLIGDPRLGPLADNDGPTRTHALAAASPAINRGNNSASVNYDQRLHSRIVGGRADIGAFEFEDQIFGNGFD